MSDISKTSDSDSELQRKLSNPPTLIKNAHSPATSQLEEKSSRVSASQPKCKEPSSSEEIISTTFQNTTDMKRDTETYQSTAHQLSQSKKEISLSLVNADLFARLSISTFWKSSHTKSLVTLESNSCFSDSVKIYFTPQFLFFNLFLKKGSFLKGKDFWIKLEINWINLILIKII